MKISTSFMFDRAIERITDQQNQLSTSQAQMAQGKRIITPSDAPDKAAAIARLRGEIDRQQGHANTLKVAQERFSAEETSLSSVTDVLIRMKELGVQAANGTLGTMDRKAVAAELSTLRDQVLSLANSRDDTGNYLFSGTRVNTVPFSENPLGQVLYQGDQTQTSVPAGAERTVAYTRSGTDVFSRVIRDGSTGATPGTASFFDAMDQFVDAVAGSQPQGIQTGLADLGQMIDNISLAQAKNGSDQSVVRLQLDVISDTNLRLKSSLSDIEDLDYATALANMNKRVLSLQATMSSFSKVTELNVFDYLR
jgi:flagellar hook-associated protein 3 FlgL